MLERRRQTEGERMDAPILVTGFEPFGGETINASWEAVRLLPDAIAGHEVIKLLLPVEFGRSGDLLVQEMTRVRPAVVVMVGEAGGRAHLTVERVAVNVMEGRIADNAGFAPTGEPVVPSGPDAYLSTLPVMACVEASRAAGMPAEPSETAGLYVCNQLMYRALHELAGKDGVRAGFVHVPYTPTQVLERKGVAFCPSDLAAKGIAAVCEAAINL